MMAKALRRLFRRDQGGWLDSIRDTGFNLTVQVEEDDVDGGYVATIVNVPGCMSQGDTVMEAVENVVEAFTEYIAAQAAEELGDRPAPTAGRTETLQVPVALAC